MVRACSGFVLPLLLVLAWQLPLPPTHSFPLNHSARVSSLPEGTSYKDSLLSGKDFLSVFVRSSQRTAATTTTTHPTSTPDGRLASPTSTTTPSAPPLDATPEDATPLEREEDCLGSGPCSPRVISVRVSSSVSGTTPRRDNERSEPPSPIPTPSPARSIFTSFLDAFAESSGRGRSRTSSPPPTPPTLSAEPPSPPSEEQVEGAAVTYEVSVSRGVSRERSEEEEGGGSGDGRRVADEFVPLTPTPKSRYEFSPPDRLKFTSLPTSLPSPYPRALQEEEDQSYPARVLESYDLEKSFEPESSGISFQIPDKEDSSPESTSISLVDENIEVSGVQQEREPVEPVDSSTRDRLQYTTDQDTLRSKTNPGSSFETRYQSLQQSVIAQDAEGDGNQYDPGDVPEEENSQEIAYSPSLNQRRKQKSLYHHYLRHQFPRESGYASAGRQREPPAFEQQYAGSEASYLVPEGHHSHREPEEMNYEVAEEVSVMSRGRVHGLQPTSSQSSTPVTGGPDSLRVFDRDLDARKAAAANQKFGYVVEGRNYRKYRVEERTSDGFIVGEYGVVNHDDGVLRGVRYTADGTINPRLIYEALMKFLSL